MGLLLFEERLTKLKILDRHKAKSEMLKKQWIVMFLSCAVPSRFHVKLAGGRHNRLLWVCWVVFFFFNGVAKLQSTVKAKILYFQRGDRVIVGENPLKSIRCVESRLWGVYFPFVQ